MNALKVGAILLCLTLADGGLGFAQTPSSPRIFVDGGMMAERDPTDFFYGSDAGAAGRGGRRCASFGTQQSSIRGGCTSLASDGHDLLQSGLVCQRGGMSGWRGLGGASHHIA